MSDPRWDQLQAVFLQALERPLEERADFLDRACDGDAPLRAEVESMLAAEEAGPDFSWVDRLAAAAGSSLPPSANATETELPPDHRIGPYRLIRLIGRGGMGRVYLAERDDDQYRQKVALKVVRDDYDTALLAERFKAERQILARLQHPNISTLLDGGVAADGRPYLVMQYEPGLPITTYCDEHTLDVRARLELFATICDTVHYAHTNLVVHRDLKPSNILVTDEGRPKLLDFGIAKMLEGELDFTRPVTHDVRMFTPEHAAPEQVSGGTITTATDVYSLGILLYELLIGHRPFRAADTSPMELQRKIQEEAPTRPSDEARRAAADRRDEGEVTHPARLRSTRPAALAQTLRGDLDQIVLEALRKEPERRYGSARELAEDVRRYLAGLPIRARPDSVGYRTGKFVRRHRVGVGVAALVFVLLTTLAVNRTVQAARIAREQERTQAALVEATAVRDFMVNLFNDANIERTTDRLSAVDLLDRGVTRVDELDDQPRAQAAMLNAIGRAYGSLAEYEKAEPLLERALALRREVHGDVHTEVAFTLDVLSDLIMDARGDYEAVEPLAVEALAIHRQLHDAPHADVALGFSTVGALQFRRGAVAEARDSYEEAMAVLRDPGVDSPSLLTTVMSNLGLITTRLGDPVEGERLLREAIATESEISGESSAKVATMLGPLAESVLAQGRVEEATNLLEDLLDLRAEIFGPEHPAVAAILNNLSVMLGRQNRWAEAVPHSRRAVEIQRATQDPAHPLLARGLANLGSTLISAEQWAEAEPVLLEALPLHVAIWGDEHSRTATVKTNLFKVYTEMERPEEAAKYRTPSS